MINKNYFLVFLNGIQYFMQSFGVFLKCGFVYKFLSLLRGQFLGLGTEV